MTRRFRVSFVVLDSLFPPVHGGAHMLRYLAEGLAARGHEISLLLLFASPAEGAGETAQTFEKLRSCGLTYDVSERGTVRFKSGALLCAGVDNSEDRFLPFVLSELTRRGAETIILTDVGGTPAHTLLATLQSRFNGLVVYAPQTVHLLPGGPLAILPHGEACRALRKCRIVAPSRFCANYLTEHLQVAARINIPPLFGSPDDWPEPAIDRFDRPFGVFNPNVWKGLSLLLELADSRPDLRFLVRCGWRTAADDLAALARRPNVILQRHANDGTTVYDRASAVLVPSLCHESLGLVSIEAMLRGLPAVTADQGGLAEAGLGGAILCRVAPIEFRRSPDRPQSRALEHVPPQPLDDWLAALDRLSAERTWYDEQVRNARRHALAFIRSLSWDATEAAFLG